MRRIAVLRICLIRLKKMATFPVPGLTHRYPDRVLFLITDQCAMYCRHCTRRRLAGQKDGARTRAQIDACIDYIRKTPAVRDVLLSGGDALLMSDERLEYILSKLRAIDHVEIIRIGTRTPVVLPQGSPPNFARSFGNTIQFGLTRTSITPMRSPRIPSEQLRFWRMPACNWAINLCSCAA